MALPESMLWAPRHTSRVFDADALPVLIDDCMKVLRPLRKRLKFNTIAVSGHSGLIVGTLLAAKLKMPLLAVRKADDRQCLDTRRVNGTRLLDCRYLVVDDLIETGRTFKRIVNSINMMAIQDNTRRAQEVVVSLGDLDEQKPLPMPKCVGVLLFESLWQDEPRTEYPDPLDETKTISCFNLSYLTANGGLR